MHIYTIGDLHLSSVAGKPMEVFGDKWNNHHEKIAQAWRKTVGPEDIVVVPGDISWAIDFEEVVPDLCFIHELPGKKILLKGNHEHWWSTLRKLNGLTAAYNLTSINFLFNSCIYIEEKQICICGTRGWKCPDYDKLEDFSEQDDKIYKREIIRLENSLKMAAPYDSKIIAFMHYPPFNISHNSSGFTELLEKYKVTRCYYGHLHGPAQKWALNGKLSEESVTDFRLVSADYLNFKPTLIL